MSNAFIKIYDGEEESGYISTKDIYFFEVKFNPDFEGIHQNDHYLVKAYETYDNIDQVYDVSPRMNYRYEAEKWLEQIIKQIKEF